MDVLRYIMAETGRKGAEKKTLNNLPVFAKKDLKDDKFDEVIDRYENSPPYLYLFFRKGQFKLAEVSADDCIIHLQSSTTVNAIVGYLAVYYVFNVGYNEDHECLMLFLQHAFIGSKLPSKASVGLTKFVARYNEALEELREGKGYKKLCVF